MTNNDILKSLRHILNIHGPQLVELIKLGGGNSTLTDVNCYLEPEPEFQNSMPDDLDSYAQSTSQIVPRLGIYYKICSDKVLDQFLNGMIIFKRGPQNTQIATSGMVDSNPKPQSYAIERMSNNVVLKKIRV